MTIGVDEAIKSTRDLIDSDPTPITLFHSEWVNDGRGGRRRSTVAEPEAPAPVDRFFSAIAADKSVSFNMLGITKDRVYILIGMPDDDIQEGDVFQVNAKNFRVIWVDDDRRYQTKAECIHAS
jgi:hypothetical protein